MAFSVKASRGQRDDQLTVSESTYVEAVESELLSLEAEEQASCRGFVVKCSSWGFHSEDLDLELDKLYSKAAHLCSSLTALKSSWSRMAAVFICEYPAFVSVSVFFRSAHLQI